MDDKGPILELVPLSIEMIHPAVSDKIIDAYGDKETLQFLSKNFTELSPITDWGYSYAQRLYSYNSVNQIEYVIAKLIKDPLSKSTTISLLKSEQDKAHTPCLTTLDFKIRNETLIINAIFRSQDVGQKMYGDALEILKIGNNIIQLVPAQRVILIHTIGSAHIYRTDLDMIHSIIGSVEKDTENNIE
ncbi:MAG: Thymidylate synthase [Segetibacter sp.]|nr:Thymidylate synthase [Segetibacter sp.]